MFRTALAIALAVSAGACRAGGGEAPAPAAAPAAPTETRDRLADEIERWSAMARADKSTDEVSVQIRSGVGPLLEESQKSMRAGRRLHAMFRFATARTEMAAAAAMRDSIAAGKNDAAGFEAEWARVGALLREELGSPRPDALAGVEPVAVRALGEAALPQIRLFHEASLEYGRNTMPIYGLFYLGSAQAARDTVGFFRQQSAPAAGRAPALRSLAGEIDALEAAILAAYRPPASVDRHPEFIAASSAVKEARELDAAGLHRGALLRYLQGVLRAARMHTAAPSAAESIALAAELRRLGAELAAAGVDHSLGRLFLEVGQADLESATAEKPAIAAAAVVREVMPRYVAALAPARPRPASPPARATVTLVRWPFT